MPSLITATLQRLSPLAPLGSRVGPSSPPWLSCVVLVWPSRQQLISESVAVLLMVTLSAAAIASLDRFFRWMSQLVFR